MKFAALMLAGETVFLLPFVVARIFRPSYLEVFQISNFELGSAFSVYGVIAFVSYFFGGPIADRFKPKALISISLFLTSVAGIWLGLIPSLEILVVLYGFWGFSTILLFWSAWIKATRVLGDRDNQGKAFGSVDAGRGLLAALIALGAVFLFDLFLPEKANSDPIEIKNALKGIIWFFSAFTLGVGLLVLLIFSSEELETGEKSPQMSLAGIKEVIRMPSIWIQGFIIICAYVGYKSTDDISLYGSDVFGLNEVGSAGLATLSFWVRPFAAFGAGMLGDRFGNSKMLSLSFFLLVLFSLLMGSGWLVGSGMSVIFLVIAGTSAAIYALRGLYFAVFEESKVPLGVTGSAVGLVSLLGYTPDIFFGPLMGFVLDNSPGREGHENLFVVLAIFAAFGFLASLLFQKLTRV